MTEIESAPGGNLRPGLFLLAITFRLRSLQAHSICALSHKFPLAGSDLTGRCRRNNGGIILHPPGPVEGTSQRFQLCLRKWDAAFLVYFGLVRLKRREIGAKSPVVIRGEISCGCGLRPPSVSRWSSRVKLRLDCGFGSPRTLREALFEFFFRASLAFAITLPPAQWTVR